MSTLKDDFAGDPRRIPSGQLLNHGWSTADDWTKDCEPGAVFMRTEGGGESPFARYDFTIAKSDSGEWIPIHGSVKMPAVATPEDAAFALDSYWHNLPGEHKLKWVSADESAERPRG